MTQEALKLALEALQENVHELIAENKALKESLRQPKQEPDKYVMDIECTKCGAKQSGVLTVNTTPPQRTERPMDCERCNRLEEQAYDLVGKLRVANIKLSMQPQRTWVGLTDEEIDELSRTMVKGNKSANWLCRAIEAKLKEKNT